MKLDVSSLAHTKWECKYHMLIRIPPKYSVSQFMEYLGVFERQERHANLKYKSGNRHFWAEGYYVSTVGLNEATIRKYMREQETQDQIGDARPDDGSDHNKGTGRPF